jgi:hypothetical protein
MFVVQPGSPKFDDPPAFLGSGRVPGTDHPAPLARDRGSEPRQKKPELLFQEETDFIEGKQIMGTALIFQLIPQVLTTPKFNLPIR